MAARRGPGEGSVFKRKDRNLWQAIITVGHDENGKRIRKTVFGKTKAECLAKKRDLEAKIATGDVPLSGNLTIEHMLERWIREACKGKKRSTVSSYRGIAKNHVNPQIGRVKLSDLKAAHVHSVLSKMEENSLAGSTRHHAYTVLNASLKWCVKLDLIPKNPCDKIDPPKPDETEQSVYTPLEIEALLKSARKHRLGAVVVLAICTGARQGEIFGLKWSDIDFGTSQLAIRRKVIEIGGKIFVETPKTKSSRRPVTLPKLAIEALQEHRKQTLAEGFAGVEWVFPSKSGEPMRRQSFNRWAWNAIVRDATVDGQPLRRIPFKNLRHAHATVLLSSGTHPKVVQERLGHSRIATTMDTYSHVIPTMQADAAQRIDDLLFGAG